MKQEKQVFLENYQDYRHVKRVPKEKNMLH